MASILSFFKLIIGLGITILVIFFLFSQIKFPGSYQFFLVQSGSMSPTINTGDLIVIKPVHQYYPDDIITFNSNQNFTTTHRLIRVVNQSYFTKGDANTTEDQEIINSSQVLGKVFFTIPKIGYFITFIKSLPGLIILIIIPSALIIYQEFLEIKKHFTR